MRQAPPTYGQYLLLYDLCDAAERERMDGLLAGQPRPDTLCGVAVPKTLGALTYGQLDDMRGIDPESDVPQELCRIVLGKAVPLMGEDVNRVFGFLNFCRSEVERINALFAAIRTDYTREEITAGVRELDFGTFGVLDWYARRMGMTNQNDVRQVAWVRIYRCMLNDHQQQEFERRLQNVYMGRGSARTRHR